MAVNEHVNKVVYGNDTLIDLTGDDVQRSDVRSGVVFHLPTGEQTTGTGSGANYVTPEDFGAVGDGVTDDSQAVQDACDAGYAVYFGSDKTYYLASTVMIDHDCHLFGGAGATIKTATPSGGVTPNGIVVTGTLKNTTALTSDYASTGTGDNGGNQSTLTDMTGIEIGDILIVTAEDQYYSYSRQYYYLGATLLVSDIYNGHIYTSNSMPWDITNTANVTVQVYSAPTAIVDGLNFVSDLDSRGNYKYLLTLSYSKNSVVRNCNLTQMDNGIILDHTVNALIDNVAVSKSKYDNALSGDGYGICVSSCSNTEIKRILSICSQGCINASGRIPNINTYIHECNLASECRPIGIDMHENSYNIVIEDCTLAGLSLYGTATVNRCRFIRTNRVDNSTSITIRGSHDPRWAMFKITNCVFDLLSSGGLSVQIDHPIQQTGVQAIDCIIGSVEIGDCTGGQLIYRPSTDSTVLSNTIRRLILHNWRDCYNLYLNGSAINYAEIIDCTFIPANGIWLNTNGVFGYSGIGTLVRRSNYPQIDKTFANIPKTGTNYYLPYGTSITFASSDTSAHYQVCGKNVISNDVSDFSIGNVTGSVGNDLNRSIKSNFANALSVNANGELVFTQPNSTTKAAIYSKCLLYITQVGYITMSCKLKNTGNTSGAAFYPYIAILNGATGKITYRGNGTAQTATANGAVITHKHAVQAGDLVLCYIYHNTAVAESETTLSEYVAEYRPYEDGDSAVYKPYVGSSRIGDGTLYSVSGYNNILIDASSAAGASFTVDYLDNPLGSAPNAVGVSF